MPQGVKVIFNKVKLLFLLLLGSCGMAKMPTSYFSKELCSCLFVEMNEENYCLNYVHSSIPVWSHKIDSKEKSVSSSAFLLSTKYLVKNKKFGCELSE